MGSQQTFSHSLIHTHTHKLTDLWMWVSAVAYLKSYTSYRINSSDSLNTTMSVVTSITPVSIYMFVFKSHDFMAIK